ncbi:MAG: S9 family peptidase, partial [Pseudomonadota bacterium]
GGLYATQYPASDGLSIPAIVTAPAGQDFADLRDAPAIILPHGGPATYDRFDFDWMAQFFASRGYLVLQPNFRGSTGFGRDFLDAGIGEWGGKMLSDIDDGVKALIKAGLIDPDRICIIGASYGGYAALAGATFTPDRYTCAIAIAPVSDLRKMLSRERRENQRGHWVIDYWKELMANGAVTPQQLDAISPAKHAENVRAPILLLHGDDDTVVDIEQSLVMERALKRANKQVEFVRLKGEDHWLSVAETRMQTLQAMDAFLKRYMPATPPPPVPTPTD